MKKDIKEVCYEKNNNKLVGDLSFVFINRL